MGLCRMAREKKIHQKNSKNQKLLNRIYASHFVEPKTTDPTFTFTFSVPKLYNSICP